MRRWGLLGFVALACGGGDDPPGSAGPTADTSGVTDSVPSGPITGPGVLVASPVPYPIEGPQIAVAPGGQLVAVAWVQRDAASYPQLWVSTSVDGLSFSAPVRVSGAEERVQSGWPRGPALVFDDDRLLVAWVSAPRQGAYRATVRSVSWSVDGLGDSWVDHTTVRVPVSYHSLSYPVLAVEADGQAVLGVVASPVLDGRVWVARESEGWAVEDVNEGRDQEPPCECCPAALLARPDGELVVAWRGDVRKEVYVARARPGEVFGDAATVTATGIEALACPLDGPQLIDEGDHLVLAWSDTRATGARAWLSSEAQGWAAEPIGPHDEVQWRVSVAGEGAEQVAAWESGLYQPFRAMALDADQAFDVVGPTGPLWQLRVATLGGTAVAAGIDEEGALWLVSLDPPDPR